MTTVELLKRGRLASAGRGTCSSIARQWENEAILDPAVRGVIWAESGIVGRRKLNWYGIFDRELGREKAWSRIYLVPLLVAEGDRDSYRREQAGLAREKEIMKDVKGWEVSESRPWMITISGSKISSTPSNSDLFPLAREDCLQQWTLPGCRFNYRFIKK